MEDSDNDSETSEALLALLIELFEFLPMYGYGCLHCEQEKRRNQDKTPKWHHFYRRNEFIKHLKSKFKADKSKVEQILAKIEQDIQSQVQMHLIHARFIKQHQSKYLKDVGKKLFCFTCGEAVDGNEIETCPDCQGRLKNVECFVISNSYADRPTEKKGAKPLELFNSDHCHHLHPDYYKAFESARQCQLVSQKNSKMELKNDEEYEIDVDLTENAEDWSEEDMIDDGVSHFESIELEPDPFLDKYLQDAKQSFEPVKIADTKLNRFHQELQTYHKSIAWSNSVRFAQEFYFNLISNSFDGSIEQYCRHYYRVTYPPTSTPIRAVVELAPRLFEVLEQQLNLYTHSFKRDIMKQANFQDTIHNNEAEPCNFYDESDDMLYIRKDSWNRDQIKQMLEKVIHYTALVVMSHHSDDWEAFVGLQKEEEKLLTLCKWIIHFSEVGKVGATNDNETVIFKRTETFYGALALSVSLDLQKYRSPPLILNADTPRRLKHNLENMLLIIRLVAITMKDKEILLSTMPYCKTVHELSSYLYTLEEFIPEKVESIRTKVTFSNERLIYTSSFTSATYQTTVVEFDQDDFQKTCNKIKEEGRRTILTHLSEIFSGNSDSEKFIRILLHGEITFQDKNCITHLREGGTSETVSPSFKGTDGTSSAMKEISKAIVAQCTADYERLKSLIELYNSSLLDIASLLYISYPSKQPSMKEFCDFTIGESTFDDSRPSIATLSQHPRYLQMSLTKTYVHFVANEVCQLLSVNIVSRIALLELLQTKCDHNALHCMSHFFFAEVIAFNHERIEVKKFDRHLLENKLVEDMRKHFLKEDLLLSHVVDVKKYIYAAEMRKREMTHIIDGSELFHGHSIETHSNNYSTSFTSAFGKKGNSEFDPDLFKNDKEMLQLFGLHLDDCERIALLPTLQNNFRSIRLSETGDVASTKHLTLLYKVFFNLNYSGKDDAISSANEILTRARPSIHLYPCGYGKTPMCVLGAMDRMLYDILSLSNIRLQTEALENLLAHKESSRRYENTADVYHFKSEVISKFKELETLCSDSTIQKNQGMNGVTLLLVPTTYLREDHVSNLSKTNLLSVAPLSMRQFEIEHTRFKERPSNPSDPSTNIWISTYHLASLHLLELIPAIQSGYISDVVFDEVHCFLHLFLIFPQSLNVLAFKYYNIPIYAFSGTVSKQEEEMLKILVFDKALHQRKTDMVENGNDHHEDFSKFRESNAIYRIANSVPRNLEHYAIPWNRFDNDEEEKLRLICEALLQIANNEEINDVILFVKTKEAAKKMYSYFVQSCGDESAVYLTGMENTESKFEREEFGKKWVQNQDCRFAICTTAGSVGINNPNCTLAIHIETYFGMSNYLQSASRACRKQDRKGYSFFFASNENEYERWNRNVYKKNEEEMKRHLKSYGVLDPNLSYRSNTPLKEIMGPVGTHAGSEDYCIQCELERHFNDTTNNSCDHERTIQNHPFLDAVTKIRAFYFIRKEFKPHTVEYRFHCVNCPFHYCEGCGDNNGWFPEYNGVEKYFRIYVCLYLENKSNAIQYSNFKFSEIYERRHDSEGFHCFCTNVNYNDFLSKLS